MRKILSCVKRKYFKLCERKVLSCVKKTFSYVREKIYVVWWKGLKLWFCDLDHLGLAILPNFSNLVNLCNLVLAIFANFG